jgi:hypothetical protein
MDKYIIEDYYHIDDKYEKTNYNQYKKYMCNKCFYQTNDYEFLVEHLYSNCKRLNGNYNYQHLHLITINQKK